MTNKYQSGQERYEKPRDQAVDHPDYYNAGGIEVLDVIAAFGLNFNTGNAVKYICRSRHKPGADQLWRTVAIPPSVLSAARRSCLRKAARTAKTVAGRSAIDGHQNGRE